MAQLIESLRATQPAVVDQIVPGVLTVARIHRTLQVLLREGVPIRPLAELLEIMADHAEEAREPEALAEIVRRQIARTICRRARDSEGRLAVIRLEPATVAALSQGAARPSSQLVARLRRAARPGIERAAPPVLIVPGPARSRVRSALARHLPELQVLAEEEISDEPRVELFTTITDEEVSRAA